MKIKSIRKVPKQKTYDLSIQEHHNYFVTDKGVWVHNSSKDYSKVDRSALYASRWLAGSLVKSGIYRECTVGLSYVIGKAEPESIFITGHKIAHKTNEEIVAIVKSNFPLTPLWIRNKFGLHTPTHFSYVNTALYGQVCDVANIGLPWENFEDISELF